MNYYTTLTDKGQITLPAALRRKLRLQPGKKLSVSLDAKQQLVITAAPSLEEIQQKNRELLLSRGFTQKKLQEIAENYHNGDGWTAYVEEKYGSSRQS